MKSKKIDPIERALKNPVARAIAKRELQTLHAQMVVIGERCLQVAHESEQRELLASLARYEFRECVQHSQAVAMGGGL